MDTECWLDALSSDDALPGITWSKHGFDLFGNTDNKR